MTVIIDGSFNESNQYSTDYLKEWSPDDSFEGFKVLKRVLNPKGAYGYAIVVHASYHSKNLAVVSALEWLPWK